MEFASDGEGEDGQDEATVRPRIAAEPVSRNDAGPALQVKFVLADGAEFLGYVTLPTVGDFEAGSVQPVIVTNEGQVMLWHGAKELSAESIHEAYRRLGRAGALSYRCGTRPMIPKVLRSSKESSAVSCTIGL